MILTERKRSVTTNWSFWRLLFLLLILIIILLIHSGSDDTINTSNLTLEQLQKKLEKEKEKHQKTKSDLENANALIRTLQTTIFQTQGKLSILSIGCTFLMAMYFSIELSNRRAELLEKEKEATQNYMKKAKKRKKRIKRLESQLAKGKVNNSSWRLPF